MMIVSDWAITPPIGIALFMSKFHEGEITNLNHNNNNYYQYYIPWFDGRLRASIWAANPVSNVARQVQIQGRQTFHSPVVVICKIGWLLHGREGNQKKRTRRIMRIIIIIIVLCKKEKDEGREGQKWSINFGIAK